MLNYEQLTDDVVSALQELILSGESIDQVDINILRILTETPGTITDVAPHFRDYSYETIRRRCLKLQQLNVIHAVAKRGKATVYLTGTINFVAPENAARSPKNTVRYRRRDLTIQEFLVVLGQYKIHNMNFAALRAGIYHLAYCQKHPEQEFKPNGVTIRTMILNLAGQLNEMARIYEKIANMTIFDNGIGAQQGLASINQRLVEKSIIHDGEDVIFTGWGDSIGPEGLIFNMEVAKSMHEVLSSLPVVELTEEEILNAD